MLAYGFDQSLNLMVYCASLPWFGTCVFSQLQICDGCRRYNTCPSFRDSRIHAPPEPVHRIYPAAAAACRRRRHREHVRPRGGHQAGALQGDRGDHDRGGPPHPLLGGRHGRGLHHRAARRQCVLVCSSKYPFRNERGLSFRQTVVLYTTLPSRERAMQGDEMRSEPGRAASCAFPQHRRTRGLHLGAARRFHPCLLPLCDREFTTPARSSPRQNHQAWFEPARVAACAASACLEFGAASEALRNSFVAWPCPLSRLQAFRGVMGTAAPESSGSHVLDERSLRITLRVLSPSLDELLLAISNK